MTGHERESSTRRLHNLMHARAPLIMTAELGTLARTDHARAAAVARVAEGTGHCYVWTDTMANIDRGAASWTVLNAPRRCGAG